MPTTPIPLPRADVTGHTNHWHLPWCQHSSGYAVLEQQKTNLLIPFSGQHTEPSTGPRPPVARSCTEHQTEVHALKRGFPCGGRLSYSSPGPRAPIRASILVCPDETWHTSPVKTAFPSLRQRGAGPGFISLVSEGDCYLFFLRHRAGAIHHVGQCSY